MFFDRKTAPAPLWARATILCALLLVLAALCFWFFSSSLNNWNAVWGYRVIFWKGWLLTVGLSAACLVMSTVIGVVAALARRSAFLPLRYVALIYIECVRGLPLLVLLLGMFYVVASKLQIDNRLVVGALSLSLFTGAYIAEIVRAGIEGIGASQLESARAIGLTTLQTYRYVIFPQAMRQILPPLAGQFASLIKDSSLLSVLGISEFTFVAQQVNSATYCTLESFLPLGIGYLVLTIPVSLASKVLEERLKFET